MRKVDSVHITLKIAQNQIAANLGGALFYGCIFQVLGFDPSCTKWATTFMNTTENDSADYIWWMPSLTPLRPASTPPMVIFGGALLYICNFSVCVVMATISDNFATWSLIANLRNTYRQSENGVADCDVSHTLWHNLVNFCTQIAKMGPESISLKVD